MTTRLLFVSHSSEMNGAERMLLDLIGSLESGEYSTSLVIPSPGPLQSAAEKRGCSSHIIPMKWGLTERAGIWKQPLAWLWNRPAVGRIVDLARSSAAQLVFSNSAACFCGAPAARRAGLPHVWSIHEDIGGKGALLRYFWGRRRLASKIAGSSCRVIVNSQLTGRAFESEENVEIVYNGIPAPPEQAVDRREFRAGLGLNENDTVLAVIGKIYEGKGQREAVLAVDHLTWKIPGLKILLIGDVKSRRYFRGIKKISEQKNMKDRVLFIGRVDNVYDYLRSADLLVIPSRVESFGRTAVEAMAVGTPVLALRTGGLAEAITEGKDGYFVESTRPESLARAISSIFQAPAQSDRSIRAGLQTFADRFILEKHVSRVQDIIRDCLRQDL